VGGKNYLELKHRRAGPSVLQARDAHKWPKGK